MARFSQLTQAAPDCVCFGRGFTIDGQGDAVACTYCPAGAEFTAQFTPAAPAAALPLELKPARRSKDAKPFAQAIADDAKANAGLSWHTRASQSVPGLVLEVRGASFRFTYQGQTYSVFLWQGRAFLLDAGAMFGTIPLNVQAHIERTLAAYAAKVDGKVAA